MFGINEWYSTLDIPQKIGLFALLMYGLISSLLLLIVTVTHMYFAPIDAMFGEAATFQVFGRYIDPAIPLIVLIGVIGLERMFTDEPRKKIILPLVLLGIAIFVLISLTFPVGDFRFGDTTSLYYLQYPGSMIPPMWYVAGLIVCSFILLYIGITRPKLKSLILIIFILLSTVLWIGTSFAELYGSKMYENRYNDISRYLQTHSDENSVLVLDERDMAKPGTTYSFFLMRFWGKGDYSIGDIGARIQSNLPGSGGELYLVSSSDLPYTKVFCSKTGLCIYNPRYQ